ncbi:MAG: 4Fe-4S binding protein [Planctomycetia bacterium]|nr:4Fe-4S binding protein [Planctomycetia bacterium]
MNWLFARRPPPGPLRLLPVVDRGLCTGCGLCIAACPHGALGFDWSLAALKNPASCTGEGRCAAACPDGLIGMKRLPAGGEGAA